MSHSGLYPSLYLYTPPHAFPVQNQFPYWGPILTTDVVIEFQYQGQKAWAEVTRILCQYK